MNKLDRNRYVDLTSRPSGLPHGRNIMSAATALHLRAALTAVVFLGAFCMASQHSHAQESFFGFPEGADRENDVDNPCRQSSYDIGAGPNVFGNEITCGFASNAAGTGASAFGIYSEASGDAAVAVGNEATASGDRSIAIGGTINIFGEEIKTAALGEETIAIGAGAHANNGYSIAIGTLSTAAQGGVALGDRSFAAAGGIAIGEGVRAERANQVVIGSSASSYRLSGVADEDNRGYQSGTTYFLTSDSAGNLATSSLDLAAVSELPDEVSALRLDIVGHESRISANYLRLDEHDDLLEMHTGQISALDGRVDGLEQDFADLSGEISETRTEARQGIAAAIAMASVPMPSAPGKTTWASNLGFFKGATAFGGSLAHRFDTAVPFGVTAGYSYGGGDSHAARVGLMGEF